MYRPPKLTTTKAIESTNLFAKGGINRRDIPEMLDPKFALDIQNYIIVTDGSLDKRNGMTSLFAVAGSNPILALEKWTSDLILYAYGSGVYCYRISTGTHTPIKTDFTTRKFEIRRYGDYAFVASPSDKIGRISFTLNYSLQTVNFTVGTVLKGATSGATAIILEDSDLGTTGTLTLGNITGTFIASEVITDTSGGSAASNGTLSFSYSVIANAPMAETIEVIGSRIYAGALSSDKSAVQYSEVPSGTNPPFTTWSNTTNASDGGKVYWGAAGKVNCIRGLGNNIVVFAENGKWAFNTTIIDSNGVLKKVDNVVIDRKDFGGARGAIVTPKGLFYVNAAGIWQLVSIGQPNVAFSDQESMTSVLLGSKYFLDCDLSNADLAFDKVRNVLLVTCAKNSTVNNLVLAYNVIQQAFSRFTGWNLNRFLDMDGSLYGGSSSLTKVYKLMDGYSDDGNDIWTTFYTEVRGGELDTQKDLCGTYIKGKFSLSTVLTVSYDIFDRNGNFTEGKLSQKWSVNSSGKLSGWGSSSWGSSGFGGAATDSQVESFAGGRDFIKNFQRLRVRITGNDKLAHSLTWMKLTIRNEIEIRRRNMVKS